MLFSVERGGGVLLLRFCKPPPLSFLPPAFNVLWLKAVKLKLKLKATKTNPCLKVKYFDIACRCRMLCA